MRGVPEDAVRRWRAQRWWLSFAAPDAPTALEALPPLPASPAGYVTLLARVEGFKAAELDRLVFEDKRLRVLPLEKRGLSLVPVESLPALLALTAFAWGSRARRSRTYRRIQVEMEAGAPLLLDALADGPKSVAALSREEALLRAPSLAGKRNLERVLAWLARRGEVAAGFSEPTLAASVVYGLPSPRDRVPPAPTADYRFLEDVALGYFRVAGPATRDDFLWWSALSRSAARHTIEDLAGLIEEIDIEGGRSAHFMLEEDAADLRSGKWRASSRVAFLPRADPAGAATRGGFATLCDPRLRARLLSGRGSASVRPLLVGGSMVGTWAWDLREACVRVELARAVEDETRAAVDSAASSLSSFLLDVGFGSGGRDAVRRSRFL